MKPPKEYLINQSLIAIPIFEGEKNGDPKNQIHVREVREIDWEKVWSQMEDAYGCEVIYSSERDKIQNLVEQQLKGEEE